MITVEDSIVIDRPLDEVFAYVSNLANGPAWQPALREAKKITEGPVGVGTRFTFVHTFLGKRLEAANELTAFEPGALVSFRTTSGPMSADASYLFSQRPEGREVTCRLELRPGRFSRLAAPLIAAGVKREMASEFEQLKNLLESRADDGREVAAR